MTIIKTAAKVQSIISSVHLTVKKIATILIAALALVSCQTKESKTGQQKDTTPHEQTREGENSRSDDSAGKPKGWSEFESIFSFKDNEVNQKLGVKVLRNDSIEFRLLNEDAMCDTEYWGTAKNLNASMDPEADEDENGEGYLADEYILEDSFKIIKIRIADTDDKARIQVVDKTNTETDCLPTPDLLLKRTENAR